MDKAKMKSDWILEILSDLTQFARENDLPLLAEHFEDTAIVAMSEIASQIENSPMHVGGWSGSTM